MSRPEITNVKWTDNEGVIMGVYYVDHEKQKMYKAYGYNERSGRGKNIPNNAEFSSLSDRQTDFFCRDRIPVPELDGFEIEDWENNTKSSHLVIRDILNMRPGEEMKVALLDRNFMDSVCNSVEGNVLYTAPDFFKCTTGVYEHSHNLTGKLTFKYEDTEEFSIPLEFHIEYDNQCWYPLSDGKLPVRCYQLGHRLHSGEEPKPYSDFPDRTRIGFRGPMIKWEKLEELPGVWWYKM